jgi:uncharacterized protein (TIGR02246 family)
LIEASDYRRPAACHNRDMTRQIAGSAPVFALIGALTFAGCAARPAAAISAADQTKADEAAIRRTLTETEQRINRGDPGFVDVFAADAVIIAPGAPDIAGFEAIRSLYSGMMQQASMTVHFTTEEIAVAGELAYEHGTYTLRISDKKSGKVLQDGTNKHVHILKRQPDGAWKTWRMMVNSAAPEPPKK